jgi:two-component system sensor histidine kinase MprB
MSLRTRLVFGAAAAVAVAIILASALVYFLVQSELRGQIDQNLRANAARIPVHGIAAHYAPHVYELFSGGPPFVGYYQLVNAAGDVYIPGDYITRHPLLPASSQAEAVAAGRTRAFYADLELSGQDTRVLTFPTDSSATAGLPANERFAVQVVESLSGVDHELAKIRLWLFLVALGGVAIASGAGFLVARSTLRPVRDLSEAAERVRATRDLSQRISVEGSDELSQLAVTFNEMLAALDDAAKRQQRLVQDASHELRTPLTSLRTNIEVLAEGGTLPAGEREQLLHDVVGQLGEMTALVSELTELARGEEHGSALEDVRLDLVAEDAIRRTTRNHPDVSIEADLVPSRVVGSPASLERAIGNLLDNAAKWSPAGSPVEVGVHGAVLTVRDHGPGIAEADVPHIFERFYRADSARSMPGSGLGLAIVRQVAEAHGGTITLEQAAGGGTLMCLRLPAPDPPAGEQAGPAPGEDEASDAVPGRPRWRFAGRQVRLRSGGSGRREETAPSRRALRRRGG